MNTETSTHILVMKVTHTNSKYNPQFLHTFHKDKHYRVVENVLQ
jgi:hypothetical protein